MKLHRDPVLMQNTVTAYGEGYIAVNQHHFTHAIFFAPEGEISHWPVSDPTHITPALLYQAAGLTEPADDPLAFLDQSEAPAPLFSAPRPEVLLVGTGLTQILLPPQILLPVLKSGLGIEVMDSFAAARTYNILMAEGRRVVVALIPPGASSA